MWATNANHIYSFNFIFGSHIKKVKETSEINFNKFYLTQSTPNIIAL